MATPPDTVRFWFDDAATGFGEVLSALHSAVSYPAVLDDPGLGDWPVRALLGHTCRAFLTIESYLGAAHDLPADSTLSLDGRVLLDGPVAYFRAAFDSIGDPVEVAARGVAAGRALGDDPVAAARAIMNRVLPLVEQTPDDAVLATPVGPMRLIDYLPTRAFELTVHSLDLTQALGIEAWPSLERAVPPAIGLAVALAEPADAIHVLRGMTGRGGLAGVFTVLGG